MRLRVGLVYHEGSREVLCGKDDFTKTFLPVAERQTSDVCRSVSVSALSTVHGHDWLIGRWIGLAGHWRGACGRLVWRRKGGVMRSLAIMAGLAGLAAGLLSGPVAAHPHVFIDTSVEVILDDQDRAVAVRIGWVYDELFSLMVVADHELDADADGVLTEAEQARLLGFDMQWMEGYAGDSFALLGDRDLVLGPPEEPTARWDGKHVRTTHLRRLEAPVEIGAGPDSGPFLVQVYDPGYYTAYFIPFDPVLTGGTGACSAEVWAPDPDAADQILKDALQEYTPDQDLEAEFPAVGKNFAEEVRVTCAAP
jgi:ABC-type uncharacterized transport system substrate-binding protein